MRPEPQAAEYRPAPVIRELAGWLASPVTAADFPDTVLRFRNDRWADAVGLARLSDRRWLRHFGRFDPLEDNLAQPLAMKYHGHQFRNYNPEIGDGRGFLFAQMRGDGRLLDLGTKGSGTTPYSRGGDGRLTLKGAVRELLATEMLEALGCNTSRTFSIIETGEELMRGDEPSPTRSAVLVRLSHGHIRIGTFQRLLVLEEADHMEQLIQYCLTHFPGPPVPGDFPGADNPAVQLMHQVVQRMADLAASYTVAGFVHGVLNTDNMNVSGESFDYGPWRWLPRWDANFTAAYFDRTGLYAFGRQAEAIHWNCAQLAIALRLHADAKPLIAALERFGDLYTAAAGRRWAWRLGLASMGPERDAALVAASERSMIDSGVGPDTFFHIHQGGAGGDGELAECLSGYTVRPDFIASDDDAPCAVLIEEVESLWAHIDERDDWAPLQAKIDDMRGLSHRLGSPPPPSGHIDRKWPSGEAAQEAE